MRNLKGAAIHRGTCIRIALGKEEGGAVEWGDKGIAKGAGGGVVGAASLDL
jgi:hypothetical protein